jgi:hypothetical protein
LNSELSSSGAEAAALQRQLIAAEIEKLRDRAARLRREREARAERAAAAAPLSGTVESGRRERHLAMNYRRAEVGAALVRKLRKERRADEAEASGEETSRSDLAAARCASDENGESREAIDLASVNSPPSHVSAQPPRCASEENIESREAINPAPLNSQPAPLLAQPPASDRSGGRSGGVLPVLLFLLVPLLGGPGREPALEPRRDRGALLAAAWEAPGAWGRSPQGQTPDAQPPQPVAAGASPAPGRIIPSHPGRRASLRHPHGRRMRRVALGARGRSAQGKTPQAPSLRPARVAASPAPGRLERRVGRVPTRRAEAHRHRSGLWWASRRGAAFAPPDVCRNEPEPGASREALTESGFAIVKASCAGLRPRDSPALRGPPRRRL